MRMGPKKQTPVHYDPNYKDSAQEAAVFFGNLHIIKSISGERLEPMS